MRAAGAVLVALVTVLAFPGQGRADLVLESRESEHFVVRYDPALDWVLAEAALEALEAGRAALAGWLGGASSGKVIVEFVPTVGDFERVSALTRSQIETGGVVGIRAGDRIVVLSPRLLARGYPWRDALNRECLHLALARLSANRAPAWLREGIARYGGSRWRGEAPEPLDDVDRSLLAGALREGRLLPLAALDALLANPPSPAAARLAFAECTTALEYLIRDWGDDGLRRVLASLAAQPDPAGHEGGRGVDAAFREALGTPLARFEEGWRGMLGQRRYSELPGVVVPAYRLAGDGGGEEGDLAEWQPLAAQNHLRLGDLLRARGNARAGLIEYERARKAAPASPFAQVKASRALLELGRAPEASAAAREAVRLARAYPAAHEALAAALAALGDAAGAAASLRAALEINPFNPYDWRDLARALRGLGRDAEAQRAAAAALRLGPGSEAFQRSVMENP